MDGLLKRIKIFLITFITLLSLLTIFGIYSPLSSTIEHEKRVNFITAAEIYRDSVKNSITSAFQDANVVASNYDTKQHMISYWEGTKTQAELTAYFELAFPNNMALYDKVVYAEIGTNQFKVAQYGTAIETYEYPSIVLNYYGHTLLKDNQKDILRITYPITMQFTTIGYVVMYFEINTTPTLNENLVMQLYANDEALREVYTKAEEIIVEGHRLYLHADHTDYIGAYPGNQIFYVISIQNIHLYGQSNSFAKYTILALVLIIFIAFIVFNTTVYRKAEKLVTDTNIEKEEILQIADVDSLTGAFSRSYFDRYAASFHRRHDAQWTASLIMIDFDNLKSINDTHGHLAGDTVLKTIVQLINDSLRVNDLIFRFGGDEFIVILEDCELELAEKIANRLSNDIIKASEQLPYAVSISYGIAILDYDSDLMKVIHEADLKMYLDKKQKDKKEYDLFNV